VPKTAVLSGFGVLFRDFYAVLGVIWRKLDGKCRLFDGFICILGVLGAVFTTFFFFFFFFFFFSSAESENPEIWREKKWILECPFCVYFYFGFVILLVIYLIFYVLGMFLSNFVK
jgi:NADH:ubiquinone oxidoreductase subunit 5 (subunit L)/multisubunit Na+/H+ antiporter MnhA subunit